MNSKPKNPLYVVKGNNVMEASNIIDMLVKKFGLEPVINIIKMLLEQVKSYPMLVEVNKIIEDLMQKIRLLLQMVGVPV